jgi:hypothetical protein
MQRWQCGPAQRGRVDAIIRAQYEAGREDEPLTPAQRRRMRHKRGGQRHAAPAAPAAVNPLWDVLNGWYPTRRAREQVAAGLARRR